MSYSDVVLLRSIRYAVVVLATSGLLSACGGSGSSADGDEDVPEQETSDDGEMAREESGESEPLAWEVWKTCEEGSLPRPELPDPAWSRQRWVSLNGVWDFRFDPDDEGVAGAWHSSEAAYDRRITVPFPWNSSLSGIGEDTGDKGGIGWYRRRITLPEDFAGMRAHLVVGAADWRSTVWVNGRQVAVNDNGYLPFRVDITDALPASGAATVAIRVWDPGNDASYPHGKQGSPWYTNVGGIWQPVWLEAAGVAWFDWVHLTPDLPGGGFTVEGYVKGVIPEDCQVRAVAENHLDGYVLTAALNDDGHFAGRIDTPWLAPWTPDNPVLQWFEFRLYCGGAAEPLDAARTYSGLRSVSRKAPPGRTYEAVHLNGTPVYIRGVLAQGYHPDGLYAYPDDAVMQGDVEASLAAGYNLARLHIKVEDPRLIHHADRLGLLLDNDAPCYGFFPFYTGDTPEARARWQATMEGMILRDYNHPSIIWWTLFNEDWGLIAIGEDYDEDKQNFVRAMLARARQLDSGRLIEEHSTLRYDHVEGGDINSFHLYAEAPATFEESIVDWVDNAYAGSPHNCAEGSVQGTAPLINTEYGPFSFEIGVDAWKRDRDVSFGLASLTGVMRRYDKLVGYIFTELYDVEFEHNGILEYDRSPKEFCYGPGQSPATINADVVLGFVEAPFHLPSGSASVTVTPFLSRWRDTGAGEGRLTLSLVTTGNEVLVTQEVALPSPLPLYASAILDPVTISLPEGFSGPFWVGVAWPGLNPSPVAHLSVEVIPPPLGDAYTCDDTGCALRIDLAACAGPLDVGSSRSVDGEVSSVGLLGAGEIECIATVPAAAADPCPCTVSLTGEFSGDLQGAPQASADYAPVVTITMALDDLDLGTASIRPEGASACGVLDHLNATPPAGGYGTLITTAPVSLTSWPGGQMRVRLRTSADSPDGLMLYGRRLGRYGVAPHLTFTFAK